MYDHHKTNDCIVMILFWVALGAQHNLQGGELAASIFLCNSHISLPYYFSREHDFI